MLLLLLMMMMMILLLLMILMLCIRKHIFIRNHNNAHAPVTSFRVARVCWRSCAADDPARMIAAMIVKYRALFDRDVPVGRSGTDVPAMAGAGGRGSDAPGGPREGGNAPGQPAAAAPCGGNKAPGRGGKRDSGMARRCWWTWSTKSPNAGVIGTRTGSRNTSASLQQSQGTP